MKKPVLLVGTILACLLAVVSLCVGVITAMNNQFGINNSIYFEGVGDYIKFDLNAEITGTTADGADFLKHSYSYNPDISLNNDSWNIAQPLVFKQEGVPAGQECITYSFTIKNNTDSGENKKIEVSITTFAIDQSALDCEVDSPVVIDFDQTATIQLKVRPANGVAFTGTRDVNFTVTVQKKL